jgi:hypothetical protein
MPSPESAGIAITEPSEGRRLWRRPAGEEGKLQRGIRRFGVDPFAMTLASSICKLAAPEGTVIGLKGLRQEPCIQSFHVSTEEKH